MPRIRAGRPRAPGFRHGPPAPAARLRGRFRLGASPAAGSDSRHPLVHPRICWAPLRRALGRPVHGGPRGRRPFRGRLCPRPRVHARGARAGRGGGPHRVRHHCTVAADRSVVIGAGLPLRRTGVHPRPRPRLRPRRRRPSSTRAGPPPPCVIGDDVWVGAKATITRGVTIGPGTVVGAHARGDPRPAAGCVAVGVPARWCGCATAGRRRDGG